MQAALSIGNDAGNRIVVLPLLMIAAIALRGSVAARLVGTGTLAYLADDFLNYAFDQSIRVSIATWCLPYPWGWSNSDDEIRDL